MPPTFDNSQDAPQLNPPENRDGILSGRCFLPFAPIFAVVLTLAAPRRTPTRFSFARSPHLKLERGVPGLSSVLGAPAQRSPRSSRGRKRAS